MAITLLAGCADLPSTAQVAAGDRRAVLDCAPAHGTTSLIVTLAPAAAPDRGAQACGERGHVGAFGSWWPD